ncbi:dienelactone hydrolase family protein [Hanstruepera ponticola]|uniref:dienelactone hydrolase family protein n=1 Tax=Hanstruepera ponticola TaxID=2042995 RepID=UPI001785B6DA|nr:dienelactone hydrolase family protein [Hanstruepera ponticola]
MKNLKPTFLCLCVLFLSFSCSNSDDSDPSPPNRTFNDVRQDFSEIEFSTGNNDIALLNHFNFIWNFRVIMPDVDFTNNNRPLIVTLHGGVSINDPDAHTYTDCYAVPGFASLDAIIISPNADQLSWFNAYNVEQVLSLVDLAKEFLPVDESKIVINGYSDGGNGSWYLGETRSNFFGAAIPMASAYGSYNQNGTPRVMPVPMYVIHGENDELFPLEDIESWIDETNGVGSDVTLDIASGLTHTEPCEYVPYLQNASDWLQNHVWN